VDIDRLSHRSSFRPERRLPRHQQRNKSLTGLETNPAARGVFVSGRTFGGKAGRPGNKPPDRRKNSNILYKKGKIRLP
jgi:hypothetical protein